ncbi:hypothetical protein DET7_155 [Salmonella phage Det7]|uniref:Uncharacterized protein n=1 Tax=Salmonella phage Det7 TaxID=454798 RepID=A0A0C5PI42_9CAUD|nr:hypothetical protein DET7_155 [Salmonella phage Det7]YP_009966772.1 hypothetical protein HYQ27_gp050 [Salmonella phage Se-J]AJQ20974.1 hypothetical protein DET7_155 [Salmonella phage Det7]
MLRCKRGSNSFKLGMLTGVTFMIALDSLVGLLSLPDFRMERFILLVLFGGVSIICALKAYKKI